MTCLFAICLAAGTFSITDGDTIRAGDLRLRVWGIDAPEIDTAAGPAARAALQSLTHGADLACAMVSAGQAQDWPKYSGGLYAGCTR
jgi:endonuclease YncB( thermonuclease family)